MGDGEKLLTHLNSALKVLLGLDIFPRVPKIKLNFVDQCYKHLEGKKWRRKVINRDHFKYLLSSDVSFVEIERRFGQTCHLHFGI